MSCPRSGVSSSFPTQAFRGDRTPDRLSFPRSPPAGTRVPGGCRLGRIATSPRSLVGTALNAAPLILLTTAARVVPCLFPSGHVLVRRSEDRLPRLHHDGLAAAVLLPGLPSRGSGSLRQSPVIGGNGNRHFVVTVVTVATCRHFPHPLDHFLTCENFGENNLLQTGLSE